MKTLTWMWLWTSLLGGWAFCQEGDFDLFEGKIDLLEDESDLDPLLEKKDAPRAIGLNLDLDLDFEISDFNGLEEDVEEEVARKVTVSIVATAIGEEHTAITTVAKTTPKKKKGPKLSDEEIDDILGGAEFYIEQVMDQQVAIPYEQILAHGRLDEERRQQLLKAKEATTKALVEEWQEKTRKEIPNWSEQERERMRNGRVSQSPSQTDISQHKVWKKALESLLTAEEQKGIEESIARAKERRQEALMQLLIAELDEHIGFAPEQRQSLLKLGTPLLHDLDQSYFSPSTRGYTSINVPNIFEKIENSSRLTKLLDDGQRKRWESLDHGRLQRNRGYSRRTMQSDDKLKLRTEVEAELHIGRILADAANKEREQWRTYMETRLELVCRVSQVSDETRKKLTTLAKGSAEALAQSNIDNMHQNVWRQVKDISPADLPNRLKNISIPTYYSRGNGRFSQHPSLWTDALNSILSEEELKDVAAHDAKAAAWRHEALAGMVLTEIEKHVALPLTLGESLRKSLRRTIERYETEFDRTFSSGWYLQSYYCCIPLEMLQLDEGLKAFFDKREIAVLRERCLAHTGQFAEQIRRQNFNRRGVPRFLQR